MPVVEGREQPDVLRQQHAVAEHVARHVADADHGEVGVLRVHADLAEVPLHAFPGAARGDAHHLVVVADAAARGERVAEPVAVLGRDRVREVGEGGRALVGGDDQVRVVAVQPAHLRRRHHGAGDEVVGHVEQRAQVVLVAGHAFLQVRIALDRRRCLLQHETALGAHRHDDGVLHHLRLDQAEHLGAEVVGPVRPAQPAARDLAAAQVDAFEARRIDEDLVQRPRRGQPRHPGGVELEAEETAPRPVRARMADAGAPVVGAQACLRTSPSSWRSTRSSLRLATFSSACAIARDLRVGGFVVVLRRIEAQLEQRHQHARDARMRGQRGLDRRLRQREADLLQVVRIRAQHDHVLGRQPGAQHQPVEVVAFHLAAEDLRERALEQSRQRVGLDLVRDLRIELEVVQRDEVLAGRADAEVVLAEHARAHVFEHRQAVGQHHGRAEVVDLEAQAAGGRAERPVQAQRERLVGRHRRDLEQVGHRGARAVALAVDLRETARPALEQLHAARLASLVDERVAQLVVPAPRRIGEPRLQRAQVDLGHVARTRADGEVHARQDGMAERDVEVGTLAVEGVHQQALELEPQRGVVGLARHVDQARDEAVVGVAPDEQAQPLAFGRGQDAHRDLVQVVLADLEQVVARIRGQDVVERLGQVSAGGQRRAFDDRADLAAQQRYLQHAGAVRGRGEQPDEAVLADHLAGGVVTLHTDVVGVAGPVHGGPGVRARDQQHRRGRTRLHARRRRHRGEAGRGGVRMAFASTPRPLPGTRRSASSPSCSIRSLRR